MGKKGFTAEQIVGHLREAEIPLSQGHTVAEVVRKLSISEQTYFRWRKESGGMDVSQAHRLKQLVAELSLDKQMLQDVLKKTP